MIVCRKCGKIIKADEYVMIGDVIEEFQDCKWCKETEKKRIKRMTEQILAEGEHICPNYKNK